MTARVRGKTRHLQAAILRLRKVFARLRWVRAISQWRSDQLFRRWKRQNPGRTHAEFYAETIERRLSRGKHHATLGARGWVGHTGVEWTRDSFAKQGLDMWPQIVAFGLEPNMRCVDYGCGSLRLGQHAIRYLEPGNYFGVDVSRAFIEQGKELVGDELLTSKRPLLDLVSAEVVEQIARWEPSFIFSNAVLTHVPPDELGLFFSRLEAMMTGKSRAFVTFVASPRVERLRSMTWAYSFEHLQLAAAIASPSLQLELRDVEPELRKARGGTRQVLQITKSEAVQANDERLRVRSSRAR
jgi:SAM-dependent methyltransferase